MEAKYYKTNLAKTLFLSFSFMMLFTAFNSVQNQVAQQYSLLGYNSLGQVALMALYLTFGATSLISSQIANKFGFKTVFFVSGLGYNLFVALGFLVVHCKDRTSLHGFCQAGPIYTIIILGSMITGACAATIWVNE